MIELFSFSQKWYIDSLPGMCSSDVYWNDNFEMNFISLKKLIEVSSLNIRYIRIRLDYFRIPSNDFGMLSYQFYKQWNQLQTFQYGIWLIRILIFPRILYSKPPMSWSRYRLSFEGSRHPRVFFRQFIYFLSSKFKAVFIKCFLHVTNYFSFLNLWSLLFICFLSYSFFSLI